MARYERKWKFCIEIVNIFLINILKNIDFDQLNVL